MKGKSYHKRLKISRGDRQDSRQENGILKQIEQFISLKNPKECHF